MPGKTKPKKKNPNGKLARFHILAQRAWERHAYDAELDISDRRAADAWRRLTLQKITGKRSSKELTTNQFEAAMLEFAMVAQDDKEMAYWATARDRRYRYQVNRFMALLSVARGEVTSWSYVRSIMDRMSLPEYLDDVSADDLQNVIAALDTHFRRICKKLDLTPAHIKAAMATGDQAAAHNLRREIEHKRKYADS